MIDIEGMKKHQVKLLLDGISGNELIKITPVTEVKACSMKFQLSMPGVPPTEVVACNAYKR